MSRMPAEKLSWVPKGWGGEKWIDNNSLYCGKLLFFVKGKKCSLHSHLIKQETFYVHKGKIWVYWSDEKAHIQKIFDSATEDGDYGNSQFTTKDITVFLEKTLLVQGDTFFVPPGRLHMMHAMEDTELFEFSTHHDDADSFRLVKGD